MARLVGLLAVLLLAARGAAVPIGNINGGVVGQDGATGRGYLMFSAESVHTRFTSPAMHAQSADHVVAVKHLASGWAYDTNGRYAGFTPRATDVLLVEIDSSADTARMLKDDCGEVHGIAAGYVNGDLLATPNQWHVPVHRMGEWGFSGTYFDRCPPCEAVRVGGAAVAGQPLVGGESELVGPSGLHLVNLPNLPWHGAGTDAHFPSLPVPASTTIELACCGGPCEFFISVYHCPPCSAPHAGGLPGLLTARGWDAGPCAASFREGGETYPMTTFHKAMAAGESDSFDTTAPTSHVVIYRRDLCVGCGAWCPARYGPPRYGKRCTQCLPTPEAPMGPN